MPSKPLFLRLCGIFCCEGTLTYTRKGFWVFLIVQEGFTMSGLVEKLTDQYGQSPSVSNLSDKQRRESLRRKNAVAHTHRLSFGKIFS